MSRAQASDPDSSTSALLDYPPDDPPLEVARFSTALVSYWHALGIFILSFLSLTGIGIPLLILWLCFARGLLTRYLATKQLVLTRRALIARGGGILRHCVPWSEKTILLDRIQDVTLSQGYLERWFGIQRVMVETAGQAGPQAGPELVEVGIVGAKEFRNAIINQRHIYVEQLAVGKQRYAAAGGLEMGLMQAQGLGAGAGGTSGGVHGSQPTLTEVLIDMRDLLAKLNQQQAATK